MRQIRIELTDEQYRRLQREAARRRENIGVLIRAAVDQARNGGL